MASKRSACALLGVALASPLLLGFATTPEADEPQQPTFQLPALLTPALSNLTNPISRESGAGWVHDGTFWSYRGADGAALTGWVEVNGRSYFLNDDGTWRVELLINKHNAVAPLDYEPPLVALSSFGVDSERIMHPEAAEALSRLIAAASEEGIGLSVASAYRSFAAQTDSYAREVWASGADAADRSSARPGHSEHQAGLAADLVGYDGSCLFAECFGDTPEGQWVAQNAWRFGFIIRYPQGLTEVTGYQWEPWHVRYVGAGIATTMHERGIATLEEYFRVPAAPNYPAQ